MLARILLFVGIHLVNMTFKQPRMIFQVLRLNILGRRNPLELLNTLVASAAYPATSFAVLVAWARSLALASNVALSRVVS